MNWQKKERTKSKKIGALVAGAFIVIVGCPVLFYLLSPLLDQLIRPFIGNWLDLLAQIHYPWDLALAIGLGLFGWAYGLWSIIAQWEVGKGTPIPSVPTTKLVVVGPYKYSRNPMTFGSAFLYTGIAIFFHSVTMIIAMILAFLIPLLLYVKVVEEKELAARFGDEYLRYKTRTRFIIPLPKRHERRPSENGSAHESQGHED